MKKLATVIVLTVMTTLSFAQEHPATVKEYQKTYTTYPFSDPNPIPLLTAVYPYHRFDGFTNTPVQKAWKVVELENDFIRLLILPEIGGKIWTAIDKSTNKPFLYDNGVIKFRDIAMRGPWTSGGLEANYGIVGHTPNCATPVDYTTQKNADGSVSCFIGVLEMLSRSYWRMEINLPANKAYFTTRSFWYNASPLEQPYYHWMNAGLKAAGNLEFIYPGNKYIGHEGEYASWPVNSAGKKIAFYEENNFGGYKSYHVFGKYAEFSGAYWHKDEMGMVRYAARENKAGTKIWIWGLSQQGMIWEKLLSDKDGQYVELQSGRLFNQNAERSSLTPFKHISFAPYATDSWTEFWYPVGATHGIVKANELGALNLQQQNGFVQIRFSPVQSFTDSLQVLMGDKLLYNKKVQFSTMKTFVDSFPLANSNAILTARFTAHEFNYNSNPAADDLARPTDAPANFNFNTAYGRYIKGTEAMAMKNFSSAEENLLASLAMDDNFLPALVQLAELYYRNMRYAEALELVRKALSIDTHHGAANYIYGLVNEALGYMVDAKDGFALAILTTPYRSAAYTRLSRLTLKENNIQKALSLAEQALTYNNYNMDAAQLKVICNRLLKNEPAAGAALASIKQLDPLNHFAAIETYLNNSSAENSSAVRKLIVNEMPEQSYLETGIWYASIGLQKDALKVFDLSPDCAEIAYWKAYLGNTPLNMENIDCRLSFPFRSETGLVLETLLKQNEHWKLKYQLALLYKDRNRIKEAKELLNSCANTPDFAPFFATRAAICLGDDSQKTLADYQQAITIDKGWRYQKLLAQFYLNQHQPQNALPMMQQYYAAHSTDYIMGMLYAKTLLLNKKYAETDAVLSKIQIIPFEGATDGRELYRETKLMQAIDQLKNRNYKKALSFIAGSKIWPENLGVGKPYEADIDYRLEHWLNYYCNEKLGKKTANEKLLNEIVAFNPRVDNTITNFQPANELVTAWALKALNTPEKSTAWLNQQAAAFPGNTSIAWAKAIYEGTAYDATAVLEKDANARVLAAFLSLIQPR
jgi:tetratricopeptide (TPR) repeat protein